MGLNPAYILTNNEKGAIVENCLYDYFKSKNKFVRIMNTKTKNKVKFQRFENNPKIIIPDLFVQSRYKELFFVESKSFWESAESSYTVTDFKIEKEKLLSYIEFYNCIFPKNELEGYAEVYVCFSHVFCDSYCNGKIFSYFVPLKRLVSLDSSKTYVGFKVHSVWDYRDIVDNSRKVETEFRYDEGENRFYSNFSFDILNESRENLYVDENDIQDLINQWNDYFSSK